MIETRCPQCELPFSVTGYDLRAGRRPFCSRSCAQKSRTGERNSNWRGGRVTKSAYARRHVPGHPRADSWGYVDEHVLVAEAAIGHPLPTRAQIHHRNEQKQDNRPENLIICESAAYHLLLHARTRAFRHTGNANARRCPFCKAWILLSDAGVRPHSSGLCHRACSSAYARNRRRRRLEKVPA